MVKNPKIKLQLYEDLRNSYAALKDKDHENEYLSLYSSLSDSISSNDKQGLIEQSKIRLDQQEKDLKKKNQKLFLSISILALICFAVFAVLYFFKKKRTALKNSDSESAIENKKIQNSDANTSPSTGEDLENECATDTEVNIPIETEEKILKKLKTFEEHHKFLKSNIKLSGLAHQWETNTKYLSLIIRNHSNHNFSGYINKLRIQYIVQKLQSNPTYREYKISYLAEECGYSSTQVFVSSFKKEMNITPSQFLEQLKNQSF